MEDVIRVGMDTSKHVFQLHGVNGSEEPVLRRKLRRKEVVPYFAGLPATVVGMEACGGSHYWARELGKLGHEVKLLPAQLVKPYVKRGKNDAADAAAICEAMSRPSMRFVAVKTAQQQAALMLVSERDRVVRQRTQLSNAIRGHAAEFGVQAARGLDKIKPLLARLVEDEDLPALTRCMFGKMACDYGHVELRLAAAEARLMAWYRWNDDARRLAAIPGVGPIGATLLVMKAPDPAAFRCGRDFAAWLGLTPKDHSTAGRVRLGGITRAGDEALRCVLVAGAMAVIQQARRRPDRASPWLLRLLERKPAKLAAVALANKTARIAWKMMMTGEAYDPGRRQRSLSSAA